MAVSMNLLAFDTATEQLALGVQAGGRSHTRVVPGGAAASAALLPLAHALLAEAGITLTQVQAVAFGRGPGAFTGLRTSCAVAQGLAFGLGCPVLAVDSLLIVAEDARLQLGPAVAEPDVAVAMDARMGEVYVARWRWQPAQGAWQPLAPACVCSPEALAAAWAAAPPAVVAGTALTVFADRLVLPAAAHRVPREADRAGALLRLALQAAAAGLGQDAAQALPLYVRDKVAHTTEERAALAAARAAAVLPVVPLAAPPAT